MNDKIENSSDEKQLHRVTWDGDNATFHCDGDRTAACHNYPDCECELWTIDPATGEHGHPYVAHDDCWMLVWVNAVGALDTWIGEPGAPAHVDGPVVLTWESECVLWDYVVELHPASGVSS